MNKKISFILISLLFSATLSALAETAKKKDFPILNTIGSQDLISLPLTNYMSGNNKYSLTPVTAGVQITPPITQIDKTVTHPSIGNGCKSALLLSTDIHLFICESKRLRKIKITFDEKTNKPKWEKVEEPIDLEALLKKKAPNSLQLQQTPTDNSLYKCDNILSNIKRGNTDFFLIICYRIDGDQEYLVHLIFDLKKKIIERRYDFKNRAESKTSKLFTSKYVIRELGIYAIYNFLPESSGVLKLYRVINHVTPKISSESRIIPNKLTGVDAAFTLSDITRIRYRIPNQYNSVTDILLTGTKPEAMLAYSFKVDQSNISNLKLRNNVSIPLPSAKYGPTFGAEVRYSSSLFFAGKNSVKTVPMKDDGSLTIDENTKKRMLAVTDLEYFYSCSQSTKANEVFVKSVTLGDGNISGIQFFTEDGKTQTKGMAVIFAMKKEIQCMGDLRSDYFITKPRKNKEMRFGSDTSNILLSGFGNIYSIWEVKDYHALEIDGSKLTTGSKTLKLEVKNQKTTGGPAPISFDLKVGKFNDAASSEPVINIAAKSVNIFPGETVKIPVGVKNAYGNNLKFKVEAKGAKSILVNFNNKKTLTIPKSGTTALTGKFNSFTPIGNNYFLQSKTENYKTGTHFIYKCNVLDTTEDEVTCKFINKFTVSRDLLIRKAFVLKDRLLLILMRIDFYSFILASLDIAKPPKISISRYLSSRSFGVKPVYKNFGDLSKVKIVIEKSDQVLIWWFGIKRYGSRSRTRGMYFLDRYTVDYNSPKTGMISRTVVKHQFTSTGKCFNDFVWTSSRSTGLGASTNKFIGFSRYYQDGQGTKIRKGTYDQGKFSFTKDDSMGYIEGNNKVLCGLGKFVAILDTRKLTLTALDSTIGNEKTKINFQITVPGGATTDKITRIIQSECIESSSLFQILATNYNQDKKWLFNFKIEDVFNGLKKIHSVIEIGKEVKFFNSYTTAFSGKVITTLIKETASETTSRDVYVFTTNGPEISINTEGMTQNEIEVSIKAEGKTPEGKFKIKKVDEVTEVKVTSTSTADKFPVFKKGETVILDDWSKIVGPVVDITANIPDDLKAKVTFNSRKSKKFGWKIEGVVQMKKVYTKGDIMFGYDGKKIDVIYKPVEFSDKYKDKRAIIRPSSSTSTAEDFVACSMDKSNHFVAVTSQNDVDVIYLSVTATSDHPLNQRQEVKFQKSQDVKQAFIVARDINSFTYVEVFNEDKALIRVRNWKRSTQSYSSSPGFDRYITPNFPVEAIDVFDIGDDKILIIYGNKQFDSLSALMVTKKSDKSSPLFRLVSKFDGLQFLEDKEYGLPENLSCEIKDKPATLGQTPKPDPKPTPKPDPKPTPKPKPSVVYTHTLTCFVDIVGAKDYYYNYKINAKADVNKKEKLITEIKKVISVQNMKGFKILKAVSSEKYTALLMEKLPEAPKPKPAPTDNLQMFRALKPLSQKPKPTPTPTPTPAKETPINKCPQIIAIYNSETLYPFAIVTCDDLGLAEGSKDSVDISMDSYAGNYLYITTPPVKKTGRRILADGPSINTFSISKASLTMKEDNVPLDKIKLTYKTISGKNPDMKANEFLMKTSKKIEKSGGISLMLIIIIILVVILLLIIICFCIVKKKKGNDQQEGSVILDAKSGENYSSAPNDMDDSRL